MEDVRLRLLNLNVLQTASASVLAETLSIPSSAKRGSGTAAALGKSSGIAGSMDDETVTGVDSARDESVSILPFCGCLEVFSVEASPI